MTLDCKFDRYKNEPVHRSSHWTGINGLHHIREEPTSAVSITGVRVPSGDVATISWRSCAEVVLEHPAHEVVRDTLAPVADPVSQRRDVAKTEVMIETLTTGRMIGDNSIEILR